MSKELSVLGKDVVSNIILKGDLSGLTKDQQVEYVTYRSRAVGLDPATQSFILMTNRSTGAVTVYATKEAAAQLNQNRSLSPVVSKEEFLMDNTIYKVTYRVTEGGRSTEDCGAVGLVKVKKLPGKEDEIRKLSPDEVADAIMKAHTKAKRRAILTHCGIGTNDFDEPLVVVDTPPKEEIKEASATIKDTKKEDPKPQESETIKAAEEVLKKETEKLNKKEKPEFESWKGIIAAIEQQELPGGKPCWEIRGTDGVIFKTAEQKCSDLADEAGSNEVSISYKVNGRGSKVIHKLKVEALS